MEAFPWQQMSPSPIIGVDEVGRGCLAGDVYACAVIIDESKPFDVYTDSKKLSASRRKKLSKQIKVDHQFSIAFATVEEITKYNILNASLLAMARAVKGLGVKGGHVLVDGNQKIPKLQEFQQTTVIKGDLRATPIAAASIVAKVARDELLIELANKYPNYGFDSHKGYSTKAHKEAIKTYGPTPVHRPTFAGVKEYLELPEPPSTQRSLF